VAAEVEEDAVAAEAAITVVVAAAITAAVATLGAPATEAGMPVAVIAATPATRLTTVSWLAAGTLPMGVTDITTWDMSRPA
jgi:hypothetical protein